MGKKQTQYTTIGTPTYWTVVFLPRDRERWWDVFSPRWCRHVLAYAFVASEQRWLVVDPTESRTQIGILGDDAFFEQHTAWKRAGASLLRVKSGQSNARNHRLMQNCSTIVARTIGLGGCAWRPMALYRILKRDNAEILEMSDEHQGKGAKRRPRNEGTA